MSASLKHCVTRRGLARSPSRCDRLPRPERPSDAVFSVSTAPWSWRRRYRPLLTCRRATVWLQEQARRARRLALGKQCAIALAFAASVLYEAEPLVGEV